MTEGRMISHPGRRPKINNQGMDITIQMYYYDAFLEAVPYIIMRRIYPSFRAVVLYCKQTINRSIGWISIYE